MTAKNQAGAYRIVLATRNAGKLKEIVSLMSGLGIEFLSLQDFPQHPEIIEHGKSFEENALIKATNVFHATGISALADDSGLEVDALGGRPGVFSARYAGEKATYADNNKKLLSELTGIPVPKRRARFVCVAALVGSDLHHVERGICTGIIAESPRGSGGFGYDPLFVPDGYEETFAELSLGVKNTMSHRAIAFQSMSHFLKIHLRLPS